MISSNTIISSKIVTKCKNCKTNQCFFTTATFFLSNDKVLIQKYFLQVRLQIHFTTVQYMSPHQVWSTIKPGCLYVHYNTYVTGWVYVNNKTQLYAKYNTYVAS